MKYMLLIYTSEDYYSTLDEAQMGELMGAYQKFTEDVESAGALLESYRLQPVANATTVRVRQDDRTATDGPFAETKEQLGGYYLIEAADLDAAMKWAEQIPSAKYGSIEVRPVWEMDF